MMDTSFANRLRMRPIKKNVHRSKKLVSDSASNIPTGFISKKCIGHLINRRNILMVIKRILKNDESKL
jgi:hypothetical protein